MRVLLLLPLFACGLAAGGAVPELLRQGHLAAGRPYLAARVIQIQAVDTLLPVLAVGLLLAVVVRGLAQERAPAGPAWSAAAALGLLALVASLLAPSLLRPPPPAGPDIVLVVLDTVRASSLSLYGHDRPTSPGLERLAAESVVFDQARAPAPWTLPSHASMFTGLAPHEHGATHAHKELDRRHTTLAEHLAEAGYETAAFVANPTAGRGLGLGQGFEFMREFWDEPQPDAGARAINESVQGWLDHEDPDRPHFLFLNYFEAHAPYEPPSEHERLFLPDELPIEARSRAFTYVEWFGGQAVTPQQLRVAEALYEAEIHYLDQRLSELVEHLRQTGRLERTLLLVTSDHGEHFGEQGRVGHQFSLHEPVLAVPLLARPPGGVRGERRADPVSLTDLFPTLLEAAGQLPQGGRTLLGPHRGQEHLAEYRRPLPYLQRLREAWPDLDLGALDADLRSVQQGPIKLILQGDAPVLYDLAADPKESRPLPPDHPLAATLLERAIELPSPEVTRSASPLDRSTREALEALGYLQ